MRSSGTRIRTERQLEIKGRGKHAKQILSLHGDPGKLNLSLLIENKEINIQLEKSNTSVASEKVTVEQAVQKLSEATNNNNARLIALERKLSGCS